MRKSAEAFRTISEVAEELDVPKHVLRFWELKFPQIRPMKRGGGRRYYRPEDVELLSGIRALLHADGYTIKGVQKILKEQGAEYAKAYGRGDVLGSHDAPRVRPSTKAPAKRAKRGATRAKAKAAMVNGPANHEVIAKAISELEACRKLLVPTLPAKKAPAKRRSRPSAN